jgi:polyphosphate glucokinase
MELRMHSLKAAPVDTANAEFQRPGVTTALDDVSEESVREAVTKVLNHFNWKGPVGVSVTRAIMRALGNEATAKNLESMMPKSKGKVATMIHTEAAAYTELMFGPGRETNGLVVVMTIGKGMGTVTYNRGQKVRNSDLKHLTWTYERELGKLHDKFDWMGVAPRLDDETAEQVV